MVKSQWNYSNGAIRLTQPTTRCSIWVWETTQEQSWSLSDVFRLRKPAVNICMTSGGQTGFVARGVGITSHGICRGNCTFVAVVVFRSL